MEYQKMVLIPIEQYNHLKRVPREEIVDPSVEQIHQSKKKKKICA
jgi:hypothetical protein